MRNVFVLEYYIANQYYRYNRLAQNKNIVKLSMATVLKTIGIIIIRFMIL
jgi:hypothetical protein